MRALLLRSEFAGVQPSMMAVQRAARRLMAHHAFCYALHVAGGESLSDGERARGVGADASLRPPRPPRGAAQRIEERVECHRAHCPERSLSSGCRHGVLHVAHETRHVFDVTDGTCLVKVAQHNIMQHDTTPQGPPTFGPCPSASSCLSAAACAPWPRGPSPCCARLAPSWPS